MGPELLHDVPETRYDERTHVISTDCWCEPLIGDAVYSTGLVPNVIMHNAPWPDNYPGNE